MQKHIFDNFYTSVLFFLLNKDFQLKYVQYGVADFNYFLL